MQHRDDTRATFGSAVRRWIAVGIAPLLIVAGLTVTATPSFAAGATCPGGAMYFQAHPDDDLLFMNPDLLHDLRSGRCVRSVFLTSGDDGQPLAHAEQREDGIEAAYAQTVGVNDDWLTSDAGISGRSIILRTLVGAPEISVAFLRLPDGNTDGNGFTAYNNQSLKRLRSGAISSIRAIDGSETYTAATLRATLTEFMTDLQPGAVRGQDYGVGDYDHPDHQAAGLFVHESWLAWPERRSYNSYLGYSIQGMDPNVSDADAALKRSMVETYGGYDSGGLAFNYAYNRQYANSAETGPGVAPANHAPVAEAGPDQTVGTGQRVKLTGMGSSDIDGDGMTFRWTQLSGPAVTLSDATAVYPKFTAPDPSTEVTFGLVVSDGASTSAQDTVTVAVQAVAQGSNIARTYDTTATASSEGTAAGQTAAKAIDGVIDGYPGDGSREWVTQGEGAGAWIQLAWANLMTVSQVSLYDRPNANDRVLSGTLTFSDGSSVAVGNLNNDGSATTIDFTARDVRWVRFTVNTVSTSTENVGLSEFEVWGTAAAGGGGTADTTAPTAPSALATSNVTSSGFTLSWTASTDAVGVTGYQVRTSSGSSSTTIGNVTTYSFTGLTASTSYTPQVRAFDAAGNYSSWASANSVTTSAAGTTNLATTLSPTVTASAETTSTGQTAVKAIDGFATGYPGDYTHEWAAPGQGAGAWIQLDWTQTVTMSKVVLYDRPNANDRVLSGTLTFSDGSSVAVGNLNNDGSATTIDFTARDVRWVRFTVNTVSTSTENVGLSEFEVWGTAAAGGGGTADTTAPTAPSALATSNVTSSGFTLSWTASTDAVGVTGYQVRTSSGSSSTTIGNVTTYSFTGLTASTSYTPQVRAFDAAGNYSSWASANSVTTAAAAADTTAPTAPSALATSNVTSSGFTLSWTASTDAVGVTGYQVRTSSGSSSTTIGNVTTYSFTGLTASTSYTPQVRAFDAAGNYSSWASANSVTTSAAGTTNLATTLSPTVTASAETTSTGQTAVKAIDGFATGYPGDYTHEWAAPGQGAGAWIQLDWTQTVTMSKVVLYDRPNANDRVLSGTLTFSDGSSVAVGNLNNDGSATTIDFTARDVRWVRFTVNTVSTSTENIGLSEFEAWGTAAG